MRGGQKEEEQRERERANAVSKMTVSVKSRLRERMREHDRANVPVLEMTVACQEKAGVLNVCNVFFCEWRVPSKPPQGSEEIMHHGNSFCCFSA